LEAYILTETIHAYKGNMEKVSTSGKTLEFLFYVKIFVVFTEYEKVNPKKKRYIINTLTRSLTLNGNLVSYKEMPLMISLLLQKSAVPLTADCSPT